MSGNKGQLDAEYLLLTGLILVVLIPLFIISSVHMTSRYRVDRAEDAVASIAITANAVHSLGRGNLDSVTVEIPPGVDHAYLNGSSVVMEIAGNVVSRDTGTSLMGNIPTAPGRHDLMVAAIRAGMVKIGYFLYIFGVIPQTFPVSAMPFNASFQAYDVLPGFGMYIDSVQYPSSLVWATNLGGSAIEASLITFEANTSYINPGFHNLSVQNPDGVWSNGLNFTIVP